MHIRSISRWGVGAGVAGGAAVAAALVGMGAAHADDGTDEINGWTVTLTGGSANGSLFPRPHCRTPAIHWGWAPRR